MTALYRPALIESAEQAEALNPGTLLIHDQHAPLFVVEDEDGKTLSLRRGQPSHLDVRNAVGWTALVPIEVEVEQIRETGGRRRTKTLYVTPWTIPDADGPGDEAPALADCGDQA